jgi:hypothetical protein
MIHLRVTSKVTVAGVGHGWIAKVRSDGKDPIIDVLMDKSIEHGSGAAPDDYYVARECELKEGWVEL